MSDVASPPKGRLLKLSDVKLKTGLSHTTIYRWMGDDRFPKPIKLSDACVRWLEQDLDRWIESKGAAPH